MGTRRNKQVSSAPGQTTGPGRVVVDSRGHNVWQWDQNKLDSTTIMLQQLDNSALTLEPTRTTQKLRLRREPAPGKEPSGDTAPEVADVYETASLELEGTFCFKPGGGFDPYNHS